MAIVATLVTFFFGSQFVQKRISGDDFFKVRVILREIHLNRSLHKDTAELLDAKVIKEPRKHTILLGAKRLNIPPFLRRHHLRGIEVLEYQGKRYYLIQREAASYLIRFESSNNSVEYIVNLIFFALMAFLVINYWLIRKSLSPLSRLEKDIKNYSNGKSLEPKYIESTNEVARINNAFYDYASKATALTKSRELFIRNIFHELNTPVTKGKLLAEISSDTATKEMLESIFNRLDTLLKELAQMEKISSKSYILEIKRVPVIELIDSAKELLYLEDIEHNISNEVLACDFKAMQLVFKNLIDNAIKYGSNLQIEYNSGRICFKSEGEKLKKPLSEYTYAFNGSSNSFGLGLYIVKEILDMHKMDLEYSYKEGVNSFCIRASAGNSNGRG